MRRIGVDVVVTVLTFVTVTISTLIPFGFEPLSSTYVSETTLLIWRALDLVIGDFIGSENESRDASSGCHLGVGA
jgi:hypothetical protein